MSREAARHLRHGSETKSPTEQKDENLHWNLALKAFLCQKAYNGPSEGTAVTWQTDSTPSDKEESQTKGKDDSEAAHTSANPEDVPGLVIRQEQPLSLPQQRSLSEGI